MSIVGIILAYIMGFLISPFGAISFGLGLIVFLALPVISKATSAKQPANFMLWLAKQPINRMAIVVSEHNDVYFKQMKFSDLGLEQINIGDETKDFEDPDQSLHYWMGIPFALADEKHGVLFDPRHAVTGERKHDAKERDEDQYLATEKEWNDHGVTRWMRGVFEMPKEHEIIDLSKIHQLADGGERAEYGEHVEERYKHSRDPFTDNPKARQILIPVFALLLSFGAVWFFKSQGGGSGGGSVVGYSMLYLLAAPIKSIKDHWKKIVASLVGIVLCTGLVSALYLFGGVFFTVAFLWTMLWGLLFLPILGFISKPIGPIAGALSWLFFRLGFVGYRRPVLEWTPKKYQLIEADNITTANQPTWYNLFGGLIGFSFKPSEGSWGAEVEGKQRLKDERMVTDGGSSSSSLPEKFVKADSMDRDRYGSFVPKNIKENKYYINTGIAFARFTDSAVGSKSHKRLQKAKDDHGEGSSALSQKTMLLITLAMSVIGFGAAILIFYVL